MKWVYIWKWSLFLGCSVFIISSVTLPQRHQPTLNYFYFYFYSSFFIISLWKWYFVNCSVSDVTGCYWCVSHKTWKHEWEIEIKSSSLHSIGTIMGVKFLIFKSVFTFFAFVLPHFRKNKKNSLSHEFYEALNRI